MRAPTGFIALVTAIVALAACSTDGAASGSVSGAASVAPTSTPSAAGRADPTASTEAAPIVSARYGYSVQLPGGWTATPATTDWDGGDVDHTAEYADRFSDPAGNAYFVLGTPTALSTADFASDHLAWLSANRGCPAPSGEAEVNIDGTPGVRVALHCPEGVFGPTLVSKAIVVSDGVGLIVTSFSPDAGVDEFAPLDEFVASMRWARQS